MSLGDSRCSPLPITIANHVGDVIHTYITGILSNGSYSFIDTGNLFWQPPTGSSGSLTPVEAEHITHRINVKENVTIVLPDCLASARLWISENAPLSFGHLAGPDSVGARLVEPTFVTHSNVSYTYIELTLTNTELDVNPTYVDAVSRLRVSFQIAGAGGSAKSYQNAGMRSGALDGICAALQAQSELDGRPWSRLCVKAANGNGNWLRVYSPNSYISLGPATLPAFDGYFSDTVNKVWDRFRLDDTLEVASEGKRIRCNVSTATGLLSCTDGSLFTRPTDRDIISCASGPFQNKGNTVQKSLLTILAAAFNRGTLLLPEGSSQPGPCIREFYPSNSSVAFNWYGKLVHDWEIDGLGYAFPYDDVPGCNGTDSSALVKVTEPTSMNIFVRR